MITKYDTKQIKLNSDLAGHKAGSVVKINVDEAGTPVKRYWRDRLKDASIDNCVELVTDQSSDVPSVKEQPKKKVTSKPSSTVKKEK